MYVDELIVLKMTEPRISCTAKLARAYTEMSSFFVKCKSRGQAGHLEFLNSETRTFSEGLLDNQMVQDIICINPVVMLAK